MVRIQPVRNVLISGASSGIGKACALHLESRGFRVFAGVRSEAKAAEFRQCRSDRLIPVTLDITNSESVRTALAEIQAHPDGLGLFGLVNNAGIVVAGPMEALTKSDWQRQFDVNLFGQIDLTMAALPLLRQSSGRIVMMGSSSGYLSAPQVGPYCASKFALRSVANTLRGELRPSKIRVSLIEPGNIATPIWDNSIAASREQRQHYSAEIEALYGKQLDGTERAAKRAAAGASSPECVARVVEHALTSRRPYAHYRVGKNATAEWLVSLLPAWLQDQIIATQIK